MGVLHGRDLFSGKWITAIITDASSRMYFVAIKHTIGDYFLAEINKQIFAFRIDGSRIKTYRHTLVKSFRVLQYDTTHYLPISAETKELELVLQKNSLPKTNELLFKIFKLLGRREKSEFVPHKLKDLVKELEANEAKYPEQVKNIKIYIESLGVDQIVTPVRRIADFIEDDLIATSPSFLGEGLTHYQRLDFEHKKVTNTPTGAKMAWIKWIALFALAGLVISIVYIAYSQGAFDSVMSLGEPFGQFGEVWKSAMQGTGPQPQDIMSQYTPEQLKAAIDRGEIDPASLPPEVRNMVESVKLPTVSEKP